MSPIQIVDGLINELLTIDNTPIAQQTFTPNVLAQFMDDALQGTIVPMIVSAREEYMVTTYSSLLTPQANGGLTTLAIPGDSAGLRVRDVYMYDSQAGNTAYNVNFSAKAKRINPDTIPYFSNGIFYPIFLPSILPQYYIENNSLVFYPNLVQNWLAKIRVLKMPNHLAQYNQCCGQVLSKNGGNQVTVDNVPNAAAGNIPPNVGNARAPFGADWTGFASAVNAPTLDVIAVGGIPYNFRTSQATGYVLINRQIVNVSGATVTLDADTYNSVQVGDFLVTSGYSPFLQYVPFEAYNLVKLLTTIRVLKAQGDLSNMAVTMELYNAAAHDFLNLITPKVENMPKKVGGGNRGALLGNLGLRRGV